MKNTYKKKVNDVIENVFNRASSVLDINSKERLNYLQFKSAIEFLCPNIKPSIDSYNEYLLNRNLTNLEINHIHYLEKIGYSECLGLNNIQENPAIYCTFHMGSYISCCYYMIKNNIDFTIVVGEESYQEKTELFMDSYKKILEVLKDSKCKMEIINGQNPNSMISMIKNVKKGRNLLFFIDGSKGLKKFDPNDDSLVKIKFLDTEIYSRKGISFLAHYLNVPIIPLLSYRESPEKIKVKFLTPINPYGDRETFCSEGTQIIWDKFLDYFKKYPLQWESIYFIHQFKDPYTKQANDKLINTNKYKFNTDRYEFYELEDKVLFDKYNSKSIKLTKGYSNFLYKLYINKYELEGDTLSNVIKDESSISMLLKNEFIFTETKILEEI